MLIYSNYSNIVIIKIYSRGFLSPKEINLIIKSFVEIGKIHNERKFIDTDNCYTYKFEIILPIKYRYSNFTEEVKKIRHW